MIARVIRAGLDQFLGRGAAAVTVPPMDGALKPNNLLDEADCVAEVAAPDNLLFLGDDPVFSSEARIYRLHHQTGKLEVVHEFEHTITALAFSPGGVLAVASEGGGVALVGGTQHGRSFDKIGGQALACITALAFQDESSLLVCIGSQENSHAAWQRDLLTHGRTGSVWQIDLASGAAARIVGGLAFPNGILLDSGKQQLIVSESWQKRLIGCQLPNGKITQLIDDLPGYPARLSSNGRGGAWLSVFAPRSQLIEFVLRERTYRHAMMAEVAPEYWVAPALRSGISFKEPMQGGALKQMGILKPWAPTRSYGLAIELNERFEAIRSLHSRAAGHRHGITTAVESRGALWLTSKGGDEVLKIDLAAGKA
jgi:hypothetical protein